MKRSFAVHARSARCQSLLRELCLLALLVLAVPHLPPLALSAAATAVLILVGIWEWVSLGLRAGKPPAGH